MGRDETGEGVAMGVEKDELLVGARGTLGVFAAMFVLVACGGERGGEAGSRGAAEHAGTPAPADGGNGGAPEADAGAAAPGIAGCVATALPPETNLWGIWIGPGGEVWVAGEGGIVGRRLPGSSSASGWSWCRPGPALKLNAIWGAASNDVWAVGDGGTILRWNGSTWATITAVGAPAPGDLFDVWGTAAAPGYAGASVWVVGASGVVRRFDGAAWRVADAEARYELHGVWGSPSGTLRVVGRAELPIVFLDPGSEAVVLRQSGGDGSWTREAAFPEERGVAEFLRISGASDGDIWACGAKFPSGAAGSFAFAAHFDGVTWSVRAGSGASAGAPEEVLVDRAFFDVAVSPPDAPAGAWFAAGGLAVLFDGVTWTSNDAASFGLLAIDVRNGAMWAAGIAGKIARWNGSAWEVVVPAAQP